MKPVSIVRAALGVAWFTLRQQGVLGAVVFAVFPLVFAGLLHAERLAISRVVASFVETKARIDVDDPVLLERLRADRAALAVEVDSVEQLLVVQRTPDVPVPRTDGTIRVHLPETVLQDGRFTVEGDTVSTEAVRLAMAGWVATRWSDARLGGEAPAVEVGWREGEPPPDETMDASLSMFGSLALGASLVFGMVAGTRAFEHLRTGPGRVLRLLMPYRAVAYGVVLASLASDVGSKVLGWGLGSLLLSVWMGGLFAPSWRTVWSGTLLIPLGISATLLAMGAWMWAESLVDGVSPRLQALVFGPLSALGLAAIAGLTFLLYRWALLLAVLPGVGTLGVWTLFAEGNGWWMPTAIVQFAWAALVLEAGIRGTRQPGSWLMDALREVSG